MREENISLHNYLREKNLREGEELFQPKYNVGIRANGYQLLVNKFPAIRTRTFQYTSPAGVMASKSGRS